MAAPLSLPAASLAIGHDPPSSPSAASEDSFHSAIHAPLFRPSSSLGSPLHSLHGSPQGSPHIPLGSPRGSLRTPLAELRALSPESPSPVSGGGRFGSRAERKAFFRNRSHVSPREVNAASLLQGQLNSLVENLNANIQSLRSQLSRVERKVRQNNTLTTSSHARLRRESTHNEAFSINRFGPTSALHRPHAHESDPIVLLPVERAALESECEETPPPPPIAPIEFATVAHVQELRGMISTVLDRTQSIIRKFPSETSVDFASITAPPAAPQSPFPTPMTDSSAPLVALVGRNALANFETTTNRGNTGAPLARLAREVPFVSAPSNALVLTQMSWSPLAAALSSTALAAISRYFDVPLELSVSVVPPNFASLRFVSALSSTLLSLVGIPQVIIQPLTALFGMFVQPTQSLFLSRRSVTAVFNKILSSLPSAAELAHLVPCSFRNPAFCRVVYDEGEVTCPVHFCPLADTVCPVPSHCSLGPEETITDAMDLLPRVNRICHIHGGSFGFYGSRSNCSACYQYCSVHNTWSSAEASSCSKAAVAIRIPKELLLSHPHLVSVMTKSNPIRAYLVGLLRYIDSLPSGLTTAFSEFGLTFLLSAYYDDTPPETVLSRFRALTSF